MIERYNVGNVAELWSEQAKFGRWLQVEILATKALCELGVVPQADCDQIEQKASFSVAEIDEREKTTDHDVAAFVDVVQSYVGMPAGKWVHYGLTSSDVVDTALCLALTQACDHILESAKELRAILATRAVEFANTPCIGRTHGVHAEPTTFGAKLALWALSVDRDIERLTNARKHIAVGKLSGAVGTYSNIDPKVEESVCGALGLTPVPATQVIGRDRHSEVLYVCAAIGSTLETIALEIRHLQRTEVREASEAFRTGQKGSSAMPHKKNPIISERICGLARVLRANVIVGLENVALWHERDISHSSAERMVLPDSTTLVHYMLDKTKNLIAKLVVYPDQMMANINLTQGLVFSQPVLLALVQGGLSRDEAYSVTQSNALMAWNERKDFRTLIEADERATITQEELDVAFDLKRSLTHSGKVVDAVRGFIS